MSTILPLQGSNFKQMLNLVTRRNKKEAQDGFGWTHSWTPEYVTKKEHVKRTSGIITVINSVYVQMYTTYKRYWIEWIGGCMADDENGPVITERINLIADCLFFWSHIRPYIIKYNQILPVSSDFFELRLCNSQ